MANEGFHAFYESTAPGAYRLALALTGDHHEAQDLTQAVFERLYRKWRRIRLDDPQAFVRTVISRDFISSRRRARWRREHLASTVPEHAGSEDFTGVLSTSDMLLRALRELPERQRQAVVLRYLEDLSIAEVADLMNCSTGTVKHSTFDGLRKLRLSLSESPAGRE